MSTHEEWLDLPRGNGRRRHARIKVDEEVWLVRQGDERIVGAGVAGVISDKSEGGFLIRHNLPLRPDEVLTVITARDSILTRVVWCQAGEDYSECGVAINSSCASDSVSRQARLDWSVVPLAAGK